MRTLQRNSLSRQEELDLIKRAKLGDKFAMETLYLQHQRLIHQITHQLRRMSIAARKVPLEDLVSLAYEPFQMAVINFDHALGFRLMTYAVPCIRGALQNQVKIYSRLVFYPSSFYKKVRQLKQAVRKKRIAGDQSLVAFIAEEQGLTHKCGPGENQVIHSEVSLDTNYFRGSERNLTRAVFSGQELEDQPATQPLIDSLPDERELPDEIVLRKLENERVQRAIQLLPERSQFILHCRFYLEMTLEATGELMGREFGYLLSREAVRRDEAKSLKQIRTYILKRS